MCCSFRWFFAVLAIGVSARVGLVWADWVSVASESSLVAVSSVTLIDDPDALVVLGPGPDGLPGRAGIDDGGNGTTDERTELGATGSDDVCRVVFGDEAALLPSDDDLPVKSGVFVVQRGAFRPLGDSESVPVGTPTRELVRWVDGDGRPREMLRDL